MPDSTLSPESRKADTGRPEKLVGCPLYPHTLGYWSKKVAGKIRHFGRWGRVQNGVLTRLPEEEYNAAFTAALLKFNREYPDLKAGRTPRSEEQGEGVTLKTVCNQFLTAKLKAVESGDIGQRMFDEYRSTAEKLAAHFGSGRCVDDLRPTDFTEFRSELASQYGPTRLTNEIQKVRTIFKWAYESELIDKPLRYGLNFNKPPARVMRKLRAESGSRMIDPVKLHTLIDTAPVPLKAMLLLGINCGFGNHDVATLPLKKLQLEAGWISYARNKTGIQRRCPLWPETIAALRDALAERPKAKGDLAESLVFVTARGRAWLSNGIANPVSVASRKHGVKFYDLRHVFRTVADATKDHPAIRLIMGHADGSIDATYRESIDDSRLLAVSNHVRSWLFAEQV